MLIKGQNLTERQRREVLMCYINRHHAIGEGGYYANDEAWLRDHAFHFVKDGSRLARNRHHCEPSFLAD